MPNTSNYNTKPHDPSLNVREMIKEATERLDDLAEARDKRIDEKIHDKDIQYQLQFNSAKEAVSIALIAQEKAVAAALEGTKEAINKADINTDKRFSLLSEKIDGITSSINKSSGERGIYVTHEYLNIALDKLQANIESALRPLTNYMSSSQGKETGISSSWGILLGSVGLIGALISIFFSLK